MDCIFCDIVGGKVKSNVVWQNDDFIAFENINPSSPVHIMVIPKKHIDKTDSISGKENGLWDNLIAASHEVIKQYKLDKTGYRLVNNGAGYHAIDHEHIHIMGGEGWQPEDDL